MHEVGFIGTGNMGEALARGLAKSIGGERILLRDLDAPRAEHLAEAIGATVAPSAEALAAASRLVVIAVKPQHVLETLRAIAPHLGPGQTVLSVAAGVPLASMREALGAAPGASVLRAMPNTPCLVGRGVSALAAPEGTPEPALLAAERILGSVGAVLRVQESQMDAVTALSGSGPAYVFRFMEGLLEGAAALGLDPRTARHLAVETVAGAAALAAASSDTLGTLRARVTSKGGTTAAALAVFDAHDLVGTIGAAMEAAAARSAEMSRDYGAAAPGATTPGDGATPGSRP
jgi:pyrroline-5-carboxylate reductase